MAKLDPQTIEVNGNKYRLTMMDPMTMFDYFYKWLAAQNNGTDMSEFRRKAIAQCLDPNLKPLSKPENFQLWFSEHPEDMFLLGTMAQDALLRPFLKSESDTTETATN